MPDWLSLARDAYTASTTYFDSSIRPEIESALRQFQGVHAPNSKYMSDAYRARSRIFRPKTRSVIRKNEAIAAEALFSTLDVVNISPEDDTNENQQAASALMQALMQYRLTKSIPWFLTAMASYQEAQSIGVTISKQYWEFNPKNGRDKPCIELIPPENFRVDAGANWADPINSSPYLIRLIPMYVKDVMARMRGETDGLEPRWTPMSEAQIKSAIKPYGDSTRLLREGQRTDSKDAAHSISQFSIVWVHEVTMNWEGEDVVYHTLGAEAMLDKPRPLSDVIWHGERPYVMGISVIEAHKAYTGGVTRITKDIQAEINENANQRMDNVKYAMNKRWLARRDRQVDIRSIVRNVPNSVTMVTDINEDVKAVETPDVTSSAYQEQDRLNLDFDDVSGAFSSSSVQSNRRLNETVGGMNILTSNANQISGYQLRTWVETWVEPVLRQLIKLEREYETDATILALAGKKAQQYAQGLSEITDDILAQDLALSVNVGMGATNPHDQVQNFMSAMDSVRNLLADGVLQQYGLKIGEVIKEIFGKLGYRDGSRFFGMDGEADPQVAALTQQVQALQAQLEAKENPALVQAQVEKIYAEIEAMRLDVMKSGAESAKAAIEAAETVAAIPDVAPIADNILTTAQTQAPWALEQVAPAEGVERESAMGQDFAEDSDGVAENG